MRVLYISPFPPARDGIGEYTSVLADYVKAAGNEIEVLVPLMSADESADVVGPIPPLRMPLAQLRSEISGWKADIVHIQFAVAAMGSRIFAFMRLLEVLHRDFDVPVVVTVHELNRELPLLGVAGRLLHKWVAARGAHLIVHTTIARDALISEVGVAPGKVTAVPYPRHPRPTATVTVADLRARFRLGAARVLLAFGFIHVDKGLDDLLQAMRIIVTDRRADLRNVRLVIAGAVRPRHGLFRLFELRDRAYLRRLHKIIRRHDLDRYVLLTGYVPDGEVGPWFDIADAVVLPYRRIEQSSVAGLANSLGVPVLASTAGGLAEQCSGSRWSFPPLAPELMAATIAEFLQSTGPVTDRPLTSTGAPMTSAAGSTAVESTLRLYDSLMCQPDRRLQCDQA